jgi:site-specific DNA-methyltransferase (adenine-specific)
MRVVGNAEYGLILFRDKLPKFNNNGNMVFNVMDWPRDLGAERVHPTQKPIKLLERLIEIFTDENEVVIDPCAGSGSTLVAAKNLNRRAYGFEIKKEFVDSAKRLIEVSQGNLFNEYKTKDYSVYKQVELSSTL